MYLLQSEPEIRLYQMLLDKSSSGDGHFSILLLTGELKYLPSKALFLMYQQFLLG